MALDRVAVVKKADDLVRQGKIDAAIDEYLRLVEEQPGDVSAANALGDLFVRRGDVERAVEQFSRLADAERNQGFTSRAVALYKKALKAKPDAEHVLAQLAEIAVAQDFFADATLYWNRLLQVQRARGAGPEVAGTLGRLAALPAATIDTTLAAARAIDEHVGSPAAAPLFAAAAEALQADGRADEARHAWLAAAARTSDRDLRRKAALACLRGGALEQAAEFLSLEVAGDEAALVWAVAERAVATGDLQTARAAAQRYRTLVPAEAGRIDGLLGPEPAGPAVGPEPVAVTVELADAPAPALGAAAIAAGAAAKRPPEPELKLEPEQPPEQPLGLGVYAADEASEASVLDLEAPEAPTAPAELAAPAVTSPPPQAASTAVPAPVPAEPLRSTDGSEPQDGNEEEGGAVDEAALIAQLQGAAQSPSLRFHAANQLGRLHSSRGRWSEAVTWLEAAAEAPTPVREQRLAALYDLAHALERAGDAAKALTVWSDLELEAGSYRDVAARLARLGQSTLER
jgi:hypothetical protein